MISKVRWYYLRRKLRYWLAAGFGGDAPPSSFAEAHASIGRFITIIAFVFSFGWAILEINLSKFFIQILLDFWIDLFIFWFFFACSFHLARHCWLGAISSKENSITTSRNHTNIVFLTAASVFVAAQPADSESAIVSYLGINGGIEAGTLLGFSQLLIVFFSIVYTFSLAHDGYNFALNHTKSSNERLDDFSLDPESVFINAWRLFYFVLLPFFFIDIAINFDTGGFESVRTNALLYIRDVGGAFGGYSGLFGR